MRYEDCPHGVKREVLENNIIWWVCWFKSTYISIEMLTTTINSLMSEYTTLNPYT